MFQTFTRGLRAATYGFAGSWIPIHLHELAGKRDTEKGKEGAKTVTVTFDDGWVNNHRFALPVLQRLSIPATFFVVTGHLKGRPSDSKRMDVSQLRDLIRAGMTIGGPHPFARRFNESAAGASPN